MGAEYLRAYDDDVPPAAQPELDELFAAQFQARHHARERLGLLAGAVSWPEVGDTFEQLRAGAHRLLEQRTWPMLVGYRIRLGVR